MNLFLLLPLLSVSLHAQYYYTGSDPASLRWHQFKVKGFTLVFPVEQADLAIKYRNILFDISDPVTASMRTKTRNLPVIMHPYASFSNGSSILAPRRIELYPKQPIALETNDFASQLLIHEVRHFAQMDRLNTGLTKAAGFLLGEQAQSIVLGIHVPAWLLEGDAVLTETLLSNSGRGRIAGFIQPLRSRLIDNRDLSYDRVWFGSYNEILPDEYLFGYFLTARGRMLADPLVWSDALGQIGKNPFIIKGLSGLTRPKTGFRFSKLYEETLNWLRDFWTHPALVSNSPDSLSNLIRDTIEYMNYFRPQQFSNHEVICLKRSLGDLPAFVVIDSCGNERIVERPGTTEDAGFSYQNGKLVWTELIRDPRWENRSWSELFLYDFKTDRKTRLSDHQRYFSPSFSSSGDRIAVISELADGTSYLQIIRSSDCKVLKALREPKGAHYSFLCWGNGSEELFAITTGLNGKKLVHIDLAERVQETVLDAGHLDIASPVYHNQWVYFTGPAGATQGLYRISLKSRSTEMVFAHPHGVSYLSKGNNYLLLSAYSSSGYRPAKVSFSSLSGTAINSLNPLAEPVTSVIQRADGEFPVIYSDTFQSELPEKYHKITHLFRFHSWSPVFVNPDSYQIKPGVVLMSQNDLSTLVCWAGFQYDKTDLSHNLLASLKYSGLYPELQMDYTRKYLNPDPESEPKGVLPAAYLQSLRLVSGFPLSFSSGAWNRKIQPSIFFENISYLQDNQSESNSSTWMAGISLSSYWLRKSSYRDLFPRWGASVNLSYFKAYSYFESGDNLTGKVILYLPGFLPNSSFRVLNSASLLTFDQFFNTYQDFPRGQVVNHMRDNYNLKLDFSFPVSYPDYHLSWLIYVKRIKANLFFDSGTGLSEKNWFLSTGIDLTFDFHLLRTGIALESGIRMMYFPTTGKPGAELLFSFAVN